MKIWIIATGRDPVKAQDMVQQAIDAIENAGGIIQGITDSGMRIALSYYEIKEVKNEKPNSSNNNEAIGKPEANTQKSRVVKSRADKRPSKVKPS